MDYDNDGIQDIISGSYDPGDIYLIKGLGDGKYAKIKKILDENELPLVHHPVQLAKYEKYKQEKKPAKEGEYIPDSDQATQWRVASFGSWVAPVDWDNDKDLDMLIGTFAGRLFLRKNIGNRVAPKFSGEAVEIQLSQKPFKVLGHANPVVADWDGDGLWDLVVGASDGSVVWCQNVGRPGQPEFNSQQVLISAKSNSKFAAYKVKAGGAPKPGVRAQICVTDYNQDGLLDLIVGDYKDVKQLKKLTAEEQKEYNVLDKRETELIDISTKIQNEIMERYEKMTEEERQTASKELETEFSKFTDEYGEEFEDISNKLEKYYSESKRSSHIWLYLRKPNLTARNAGPQN